MQISNHDRAQSFGQFGLLVDRSFTNYVVVGFTPDAVTETSYFVPTSNKEFNDIQATRECGFTLKFVADIIITYIEMLRTDKYSKHSSIIFPVGLNV